MNSTSADIANAATSSNNGATSLGHGNNFPRPSQLGTNVIRPNVASHTTFPPSLVGASSTDTSDSNASANYASANSNLQQPVVPAQQQQQQFDPTMMGQQQMAILPIPVDTPIEGSCCAGEYCGCQQGLALVPDANGNLTEHKCPNCLGNYHCEMFGCAYKIGNIEQQFGCRIDNRLVHTSCPVPSENPNSLICTSCIRLLVGPSKSLAQLGGNQIGGGVGSSGNTTNNNNNNTMGAAAPTTAESLLALAAKDNLIAWEDIISSVGQTNKVKNSTKCTEFTRLQGIMVNGHLLASSVISLTILRKIGSKLGISGSRTNNKQAMCEALVQHRAQKEQQKVNGTLDAVDPSSGALIRINTTRYLNVIHGEKMKEKIASMGAKLTKQELENKLAADQTLHETILDEYNDASNPHYGQNAHGTGSNCGYHQDASKFTPIPRVMWKKSAQKFKDIGAEYENYFNRWKKSGNHCDFEDVEPDESSCNNPSMIYMHHWLKLNPELRNTCMSTLPDGVFCESSAGAPKGGNNGGGKGKGSGKPSGGKKGKGSSSSGAANSCLASITTKNNMLEQKACGEMYDKLNERQMTEKGNKKRYKEELLGHFGDKKSVQASLKKYKQMRSEEGNAPPVEDPLLDDLSDDDDDFTESQESTLGNYVESEEKIAFISQQIKHTESKMKAYAQQNTQNTE